MLWRRNRRSRPDLDRRHVADAWQIVSLLLDYPDETLVERLPMLTGVIRDLPEAVAEPLSRLVDHLGAQPLGRLQRDYVETFDVTRKCCLHLSFFTHGDTRKRGVALVQFKQAYRRHGAEIDELELPDHLCVLLEFGALHDVDTAWKLLNDHRVGIELLHRALTRKDSPWTDGIRALRATLPTLAGDDEQALAALIAQGPPTEEVGLDSSPYSIDPRLNPKPESSATHLGATIPVGLAAAQGVNQ
ncbi:MAG: nitrate reductase molybdenum cofactor assembly chaperone [Ornithinimicrobium sp.]